MRGPGGAVSQRGAVAVEELRSPGCLFAENRDLELRVEELQEANELERAQRAARLWDVEERLRVEAAAHELCKKELEEKREQLVQAERAAQDTAHSAGRWSGANDRAQRRNRELLERVRELEQLRAQEVEALTRKAKQLEARAEEMERRVLEALKREECLAEALEEEKSLRLEAEAQLALLRKHSEDLGEGLAKALAEQEQNVAVVRNAHRAQLEARFLKKNFGKRGSVPEMIRF